MSRTARILVVAAIVLGSATAAVAQAYYVPTEQQRYYDRNAGY